MAVPTNLQAFTVAQLTALLAQSNLYDAQAIIQAVKELGLTLPFSAVFSGELTGGSAVSPSDVSITPVRTEWVKRIRLQQCYAWAGDVAAGGAGNFSFAELTNDGAVTLLVRWAVGFPAATGMRVNAYMDTGAKIGADVGVAAIVPLFQLTPAQPAAVARVFTGNAVAALPGTALRFMPVLMNVAGETPTVSATQGEQGIALLGPGGRLLLWGEVANNIVSFSFGWAESPAGFP